MAITGKQIYLGVGSNLGNSKELIEQCLQKIESQIGTIHARSALYRSAAWGYESDREFLNGVIALSTDCSPEEVLIRTRNIEIELGSLSHRKPDGSYDDRLIDIDLLDYDGIRLDTPSLTLPHPRMHLRDFVLQPLVEIAPGWKHPLLGQNAQELLDRLGTPALKKIAPDE